MVIGGGSHKSSRHSSYYDDLEDEECSLDLDADYSHTFDFTRGASSPSIDGKRLTGLTSTPTSTSTPNLGMPMRHMRRSCSDPSNIRVSKVSFIPQIETLHFDSTSTSPVRKSRKPAFPLVEEAADDTRSYDGYSTVRFASFSSDDPPPIVKEDNVSRLKPNELQKLKYISESSDGHEVRLPKEMFDRLLDTAMGPRRRNKRLVKNATSPESSALSSPDNKISSPKVKGETCSTVKKRHTSSRICESGIDSVPEHGIHLTQRLSFHPIIRPFGLKRLDSPNTEDTQF